MKTRVIYYKGILKCQFQTTDAHKLSNGSNYTRQSSFTLEPRFRLNEAEEISEDVYNEIVLSKNIAFIRQTKLSDIECSFKNNTETVLGGVVKKVNEIVLILDKPERSSEVGDKFAPINPLGEYIKQEENKFYSPFEAFTGKTNHGKIKGSGYCKIIEYVDEENKPLPLPVQQALIKTHQVKASQMKSFAGLDIPAEVQQKGCFGRTRSTGLLAPGGSLHAISGCFGSQSGNRFGCFNPGGMSGSGCMLPLLLLLGFGALLYGLFGMKGCTQQVTPAPIIIHDTIKVEIKKIDTLTIVKTDTISYVDSTVKQNYETVSLPNVQFITNSDVLLPSSAPDLQKLAEYLIKNDSLKATIYGHTDNIGMPEENLKLSQRRAESVKRFLESLGVNGQRLNAVGKGDKEPRADNNSLEGRLINRRVEVQLTNTEVVTTSRTKKESRENKEP